MEYGYAAVKDYDLAVLHGIVKIASKMGISTIQSYQGSQIFEAIGISKEVVDKYFTDTVSRVGGVTLKERRNLDYIYKPYREAGGNGDCQIGYEACEKLPTLSDEEAMVLDRRIKRREYGIEE